MENAAFLISNNISHLLETTLDKFIALIYYRSLKIYSDGKYCRIIILPADNSRYVQRVIA